MMEFAEIAKCATIVSADCTMDREESRMNDAARRIAYLGPMGTFSEEAATRYAHGQEGDFQAIPFPSFPAVAQAVETGVATEGVLPFENSLEGAVSATLDILIHETPLRIRGEAILPVRHLLWGRPGSDITGITRVISHPQALGQCRHFLDRLLPGVSTVAALSTAGAVEQVMRDDACDQAAIGTQRAGELFGATPLASDIQDEKRNFTRFIVLSHADHPPTGHDKTSLVFTTQRNVPGSLQACLAELAQSQIQLIHIESRPQKMTMGEYYFLIEFEGHREDPVVAGALDRLRSRADIVTVFGSYPATAMP
ncbi:MAG: prephenate dehydratase [Chloroflexota bacterium]|nr:prephenate dehydratase [Chloroflexota bacterium]